MKMIIDIDERAYKGCVKLKNNDDMGVLGFHLINATANGILLEEELKKIKAEIMGIGNWREIYEVPNGYVVECLNIIDKHIAELKGE